MRVYNIRIETEDGNPVAWIDIDGLPVIKQPSAPGSESSAWTSSQDAQSWAEDHVAQLQSYEEEAEAKIVSDAELIAQAKADSDRLARIEDKLNQLLGI
jgi:hypothetical protein